MKVGQHVGFISTRLCGADGVSLESAKWEHVLERNGLKCFYMAGELDRDPERSMLVPEAHFTHPRVLEIQEEVFSQQVRPRSTTDEIQALKVYLKNCIEEFAQTFEIDLFVIQNALAIPMNLPLGLAITEFIAETGMPTIAHHHDFFWERQRFLSNCVWDHLNMAFPPHLPFIRHVVINSSANNQLGLRSGVSSTIIPNVMDFNNPPEPPDEYSKDLRADFGVNEGELLVLQPTRVVRRKGIEHAIELVNRLKHPAKLVISHAAGDEGFSYERRVRKYSEFLGVETLFCADRVGETRRITEDGKKIYTLEDVYPHADLVTYPSMFEGFGNAFLESVYFRKPIVLNNYSIYSYDIAPKGFKCVVFDGFVTDEDVTRTEEILNYPDLSSSIVEHNYELGRKYYSFEMLERKLMDHVKDLLNLNTLS